MRRVLLGLGLTAALVAPAALAATRVLSIPAALQLAYAGGPDLATALNDLASARSDLAAKKADPSTLAAALLSSQNALELAQVKADGARLSVAEDVMAAHLALYENGENIKVLSAQLALDQQNLVIAQAKLAAKAGTALDVSKAASTIATSRQNLADARAQTRILASRLAPLLGLPAGSDLTAGSPPAFAERKVSLTALESGLEKRLSSVVQALNAVEEGQLSVRLANNDYTPPATLRQAQATLANASRSLDSARKSALTTLRDAYRSLTNSFEQVSIQTRNLSNARTTLAQDQTRFKAGTIARIDLQTSELAVTKANYALIQARDAYLKALAALSTAAGRDVTGLTVTGKAS